MAHFNPMHHPDKDAQVDLKIAYDEARLFVSNFQNYEESKGPKGLYLYGSSGSGKTMLACIILNEIIVNYLVPVRYMKITRGFFNRIRASYNVESDLYGTGESLFNSLADVEVLVIDDFGIQADSEWEQRTWYDLIDARYENENPTVITSNSSPHEMEQLFKGRAYSRLKEMTKFQKVMTDDYRDTFQRG